MNVRSHPARYAGRVALLAIALSAPALAADIMSRATYIDYRAERICAEKRYSYPDAASFEREMARVDRLYGIKPQDRAKMDELDVKYMDDETFSKAVDDAARAKCPYSM